MSKTKYLRLSLTILLSALFVLNACRKEKKPATPSDNNAEKVQNDYNPTPYELNIPPLLKQLLPEMRINPDNPLTEEGVALGRKLYYDPILSMNGNSCSTCHHQSLSFSISGIGPTGHSVPPHINLGWNPDFTWEGAGDLLDNTCIPDLQDGNVFLNANNDTIKTRLNNSPIYMQMFQDAFGVNIVTVSQTERQKYISYAISQFMRTLISGNSKFDRYLMGQTVLTSQEFRGLDVFMREDKGDCFHCHGDPNNPLWTDNQFHNNGLDSVFTGINRGRYLVTGDPHDMGKFSTPTLRNIALTAPYMHDGRFQTLQEVIDFSSEGLVYSPTIDPLMKKIAQGGAQLSPQDKSDLIAFLNTLTDTSFVNNPAFGPPPN